MRTRRIILILIAAAALAQAPEDDLAKAKAFLDRKQYTLAIETIERVLTADPKNSAALKMKIEAGRLAATEQSAAKIDQMLVEAQAYADAGQPAKAGQRLKEILAIDPKQKQAEALLSRLELESEMDLLQTEGASTVKEGDFVDMDKLDERPQAIRRVPPAYPRRASQFGVEGEVQLIATIGTDGSVKEVKILRRIEGWNDMTDAAVKAVKGYAFTPPTKGGVKVTTMLNVAVVFRMSLDRQP